MERTYTVHCVTHGCDFNEHGLVSQHCRPMMQIHVSLNPGHQCQLSATPAVDAITDENEEAN